MGVIGCILGFLVVIYLVYKDWSSYLATFFGMCVVVLLTGDRFPKHMSAESTLRSRVSFLC